MSSPFQKSFSAKSPLAKHDPKALKAGWIGLDRAGRC